MKKHLIILSLFLISFAYGYKINYVGNTPMHGYCPCYTNSYPIYNNRTIYRQNYNPFRNNYSYNTLQQLRRIKRLERAKLNKVGFLNRNAGSLTGYSVPINKNDIYSQTGIMPYNPKSKQKYNSINCNQELYSLPSGNEIYYRNGEYYKNLGTTTGKTGVTIIYD